jgi:hypothetical protein
MGHIHTLTDIEEIEQVPLAERQLPESTYAMIRQSALSSPDNPALSRLNVCFALVKGVLFGYTRREDR